MFRKSRIVVGLDIGSSAVKAVELKTVGKEFRVSVLDMEPLLQGLILDPRFGSPITQSEPAGSTSWTLSD